MLSDLAKSFQQEFLNSGSKIFSPAHYQQKFPRSNGARYSLEYCRQTLSAALRDLNEKEANPNKRKLEGLFPYLFGF